mmetsp:Transcript_107847/g.300693  ORF Transcript_107847/g.300693 Transcript_107847/m.300693 type:complete len:272 (+) Transcript_107847:501-1316(+)
MVEHVRQVYDAAIQVRRDLLDAGVVHPEAEHGERLEEDVVEVRPVDRAAGEVAAQALQRLDQIAVPLGHLYQPVTYCLVHRAGGELSHDHLVQQCQEVVARSGKDDVRGAVGDERQLPDKYVFEHRTVLGQCRHLPTTFGAPLRELLLDTKFAEGKVQVPAIVERAIAKQHDVRTVYVFRHLAARRCHGGVLLCHCGVSRLGRLGRGVGHLDNLVLGGHAPARGGQPRWPSKSRCRKVAEPTVPGRPLRHGPRVHEQRRARWVRATWAAGA